jgi:hypothetical protein
MANWEYGGFYKDMDMDGEIHIGTGIVKVHDLFNPLPDFMKKADCLFVDPPWNIGNLRSFYTKADREDEEKASLSFPSFYDRLFECIKEIAPKTLYIEMGKQYVEHFTEEVKKLYPHVRVFESTYYYQKKNKCYVINGRQDDNMPSLDGLDEEEIIKWICEYEDFNVIGDLCMGRGLVGWYANLNKRQFVGTELNKKRLAVLVQRIKTGQKNVKGASS